MRKRQPSHRPARSLAPRHLADVIGGAPQVDTHELDTIELTFRKIESSHTTK